MVEAGGVEHVVKTVEAEGREVELLSDFFLHFCVFRGVRVAVFLQGFHAHILAFKLFYDPTGNQVHLAL